MSPLFLASRADQQQECAATCSCPLVGVPCNMVCHTAQPDRHTQLRDYIYGGQLGRKGERACLRAWLQPGAADNPLSAQQQLQHKRVCPPITMICCCFTWIAIGRNAVGCLLQPFWVCHAPAVLKCPWSDFLSTCCSLQNKFSYLCRWSTPAISCSRPL